MITRKATLIDLAKLATKEGMGNFVPQWITFSRNNPIFQSLVTVEKKEILLALFSQFKNGDTIEVVLLYSPTKDKNQISFLLKKSFDYFYKEGFKPKFMIINARLEDDEILQDIGFEPTVVTYVLEMEETEED